MIPNECVVIGGGHSIAEGISLGLKDKIQNKFVIACNYAYRHFDSTFVCFNDRDFYFPRVEKLHNNPNIYEQLKALPLLVGLNVNGISEFKLDNTILLKKSDKYTREKALQLGFYSANLSGVLALTLASFLMNYTGRIFLLGFDWTLNNANQTHYYNDISHYGLGLVKPYKTKKADSIFSNFIESAFRVYNVSLTSNINCFEKLSYSEFFDVLTSNRYDQNYLRNEISTILY